MKAAPLLPGESYLRDEGSTHKEVNEQPRGYKKNGLMGN